MAKQKNIQVQPNLWHRYLADKNETTYKSHNNQLKLKIDKAQYNFKQDILTKGGKHFYT